MTGRALLLAAMAALGTPAALAAQAGAGDPLRIDNTAYLTYRHDDGTTRRDSALSTVYVQQTAALSLVPSRDGVVTAGERKVLPHLLSNLGNGADQFRLVANGPSTWTLGVYVDVDGDNLLGPADQPLAGAIALAAGASARLLLVADVPASAPAGTVTLTLVATSVLDATATASVQDRLLVSRPRQAGDSLFALVLGKAVDRQAAASGDTLLYTVSFANLGTEGAPAAEVGDTLPAGLRYVPGSLRRDGQPLTDAADADAGIADATAVRVALGTLAAGTSGTVSFRVVVADDARGGTLRNVATLVSGDSTATAQADVAIEAPELALTKTVVGADSVRIGDDVTYALAWENRSAQVAVRGAVLVDTLPASLAFVSAQGNPTVAGRIVRWELGSLAAGQGGEVRLVVRAVALPAADSGVVNVAVLTGANAAAATAAALRVQVGGFAGDELAIAKSTAILEAGLGDAVPYAVTLTNRSRAPLSGIVVHDVLPEGLRFLRDGLQGADSVAIVGREVRFFVAAPLDAGARLVVRYNATVVTPGRATRLVNAAFAEAAGGTVRTDTARAVVRVRRQLALRSQLLVGKVWFDRDRDGRQQPGELGAARIQVWSADGLAVTTDGEGRFSIADLPAGTHALRLDTLGVPRGWQLASESEQVVMIRADGWTTPRVTFRLVPAPGAEALCDSTMAANALGAAAGVRLASRDLAAAVAAPAPAGDAARVAPLRTAADREEEARNAFVTGPVVRFLGLADGAVIASNRVYVGVLGEPGMPVRLYDGATLLREAALRPDGRQDFVGIELAPGPHALRVAMRNSFQQEKWDSIAVHRSGDVARLEVDGGVPAMRAESPDSVRLRVRLLDRWRVPVATRPTLTVAAEGADVVAADADAGSVGMQLQAAADGVVTIPLRAGRTVGLGQLVLGENDDATTLSLRVLPSARPLIATGAGAVGIGAAPRSFGAVTMKGAVGDATAVTVSYDSRRSGRESEFFGRGYDPLDEARYPTVGDGSRRDVAVPSSKSFSARLEHGFDWLEVGDVATAGFGAGEGLSGYRRSITGVSGRLATGAAVWQGFGSVTRQALEQRQLRGDGSSGPYLLGGGVRQGSERVAVEVRARDNAARVIAREELVRFVDYTIDYASGAVLLRRQVPAADPYGNPVFLVATIERLSGGDAHLVGGLRLQLDAKRVATTLGTRALAGWDSVGFGVSGVHDEGGDAAVAGRDMGYDLTGAALTLRRKGTTLGLELAHGASADSSGTASQATVKQALFGDRARLDAGWMSVTRGFAAPGEARLAAAVDELRLGGELRVGDAARVQLRHEWQRFTQYDVARNVTTLRAEQLVGARTLSQELGLTSDVLRGGAAARALQGRASALVSKSVDLWLDGVAPLSSDTGLAGATRPAQVGVGAGYRLPLGLRLEGSHRFAKIPGVDATYQVSRLDLRAERVLGGEAWGGLEHTADARAGNAAVLGWNQRLALAHGWSASSTLERRVGLGAASLVDPVRALPFAQPERDRWSVGAGLEWLPGSDLARFGARGELHDGRDRDGSRVEITGDAAVTTSVALITRHDWAQYHQVTARGREFTRQDRSLVGLAMRPADNDRLNALVKAEWRRTLNPIGGALVGATGPDERLVASTDVIWEPAARTELAARYAARFTDGVPAAVSGASAVRLQAHFMGARAERTLPGFMRRQPTLRARLDGRMLVAPADGATAWSLAPSLVAFLGPRVELEGGWRAGRLQDLDFAANGGRGLFATLGVRFTEDALRSPAAFWRERVSQ